MYGDIGGKGSWREQPLTNVAKQYTFKPTVDQSGGRMLFDQSYVEKQRLEMNALFARMTKNGEFQIEAERKWTVDKKTLFGETSSTVLLGETEKRQGLGMLGTGVINDSDMYLPFCLGGTTYRAGTPYAEGPFTSGVFHSTNSGVAWQMERISDFESEDPSVCRSKNYCYYFTPRGLSQGYGMWFSRKPVGGDSWEKPGELTKTYATTYGRYAAAAEVDTVHVCWMDCQNDMKRFNVDGPNIENDDIVYCHRKDSDSGWSKEVNLSKGLLYSYPPSMSVEGNDIVVAWAGIRSAGKHHNEYDQNDIYYVTSKDGGETWTKPLMVTDRAKDGITSGKPQVLLLRGVIHLFYIQGALEESRKISPGLTKLHQGPWPIYYQHRPFPN